MAKPNFQYEKRQKELEKKRRKEEKLQRKADKSNQPAPDQQDSGGLLADGLEAQDGPP